MIGQYANEIAAVVGAIYIIARVIVYLTPTPRDDVELAKVGTWLKVIATVIGLDLKQGIEKYKQK